MDKIVDIFLLAFLFGVCFLAAMLAYYAGQKLIDHIEEKIKE